MTEPTAAPSIPPSSWRYRIFVAVGMAVAATCLYVGVHLTNTGDPDPVTVSGGATIVEQVVPRNGTSELRQSEFGIDLAPGYDAGLVVDGTPIPTAQLRRVPEQNQVFFTPGKGKAVEELDAGRTCVVADVFKTSVGQGTPQDQTVQWCFDVL